LNVGGSIGLIIVTWVSPLLAMFYGWRLSIIIQGVAGIVSAIVIWFSLKDGETSKRVPRDSIVKALRQKGFWVLALAQFIRLGSYYTFIAWLPLMLKEEYGLDILLVGAAMSLFNIADILSNPAGGVLNDSMGEKTVLMASFIMLAVNVYAFTVLPSGVPILLTVFLLCWLINFVRSPSFTIIPRLFGSETTGSLSGIHNTFASLGALAFPLMLGVMRDATNSYNVGWLALSTLMIVDTTLTAIIKVPKS